MAKHKIFPSAKSGKLSLLFLILIVAMVSNMRIFATGNMQQQDDTTSSLSSTFPGVSRDILPFCSSRPSLPINLAMMVVHVKRDISFNYKLYLLSDNYVFQTGQVIPRDDFKIHAFPAKMKRLSEFWPNYPRSFMQPVVTSASATLSSPASQMDSAGGPLIGNNLELASGNDNSFIKAGQHDNVKSQKFKILPVASFSSFDINTTYLVRKDFGQKTAHILRLNIDANSFEVTNYVNITDRDNPSSLLVESDLLHWDDDEPTVSTATRTAPASNMGRPMKNLHINHNHQIHQHNHEDYDFLNHPILADVNTRIMAITQIYEEWITRNYYTIVYVERRMSTGPIAGAHQEQTAIKNSSSELPVASSRSINTDDDHTNQDRPTHSDSNNSGDKDNAAGKNEIVTIYDRLIFRGASTSLLAADQLDYPVEAAAFITEKNRLHYWLEFLSQGENRFQLRAIEWATRPFKVHSNLDLTQPNWQLLDNEELLLCPPSVCYSYQPIDEIVDYGFIPMPPLEANLTNDDTNLVIADNQLNSIAPTSPQNNDWPKQKNYSSDLTITSTPSNRNFKNNKQGDNDLHATLDPEDAIARGNQSQPATTPIDVSGPEGVLARFRRFFNYVVPKISETRTSKSLAHSSSIHLESHEYMRRLRFDTKLHLRDWVWPLRLHQHQSTTDNNSNNSNNKQKYEFRYDEGHRNAIKAKTDNYGYIVTGHNIDASFRVFNEIYLISANLLITINYTQSNESVVTKTSLRTEYPALESANDDPITAAYYDRYQNQVYFIKGDRYVCYDYSNKSLQARFQNSQMAPIVSLIGHQLRVDAIYHSLSSDIVYVFSGMRYYTYKASEFTDGYSTSSSRSVRSSTPLSEAKCISSKFLSGCQFDKAYKNPCQERQMGSDLFASTEINRLSIASAQSNDDTDFVNIQQSKIRNLVSSSGQSNNKLIYNPDANVTHYQQNLTSSPEIVPLEGLVRERHPASCASQAIITYLTILSILLTSIIGVILVVMISNWRRLKLLLAGPTEPYLDRAALNKVKNFPLSEPELSNSSL